MLRKLLCVSLLALGLGLTGCIVDPTDESSAPSISGPSNIGTVSLGTPRAVTVTVEADDAIQSVYGEVDNSSGIKVSTIDITKKVIDNGTKSQTIQYTITAGSGTSPATYYLKVTATSGLSATVNFPFFVEGSDPSDNLYEGTVTLGSYKNATYGSSIDLDYGEVMKVNDAKKDGSGIDLVYTYSQKLGGASAIFNPLYAKDSSNIPVFSDWVNPNDTYFHKVNVDFDAITTESQVASLYDENQAAPRRLAVQPGDVIVVKTDEGRYVLVKIVSVYDNESASAVIKYAN